MVMAQRQKYRLMEQNRKPRYKSTRYGHLIFEKGGKNIQWRKNNLFNNVAVKTDQTLVKE